jgi:hypothetical protein
MSLIRQKDVQQQVVQQAVAEAVTQALAVLDRGGQASRVNAPTQRTSAGQYDNEGSWEGFYAAGDPVGEVPVGP